MGAGSSADSGAAARAFSASACGLRSSARRIVRKRSRYGSGSARRAASIGFRQAATGRFAVAAHGRPVVEEGRHLDHHRLGLPPQPTGELGRLEGVEVQPRVAEGGGVGGVGALGADVVLIGPDLDQLLPQPGAALGLLQAGLDLAAQGLDLRPLSLGPLQRRQGVAPRAGIAGLATGPVAQRRGLGEHLGEPRGPLLVLLEQVGEGEPARGGQHQQRGRQPDLEPPGAPLDPGALVGLGGGVGGLLGAGGLGGAGELGGAEAVLHAGEIRRDPLGHRAGVPRAVLCLARQAVLRDGDQLGVGPAGAQAGRRVGQVAQRRLAEDLARGAAQEGRLAGEDLAEDRAQREDVGALVDPVALAAGLLGRHVGRRAHRRAGAGQAGGVGAAAGRWR